MRLIDDGIRNVYVRLRGAGPIDQVNDRDRVGARRSEARLWEGEREARAANDLSPHREDRNLCALDRWGVREEHGRRLGGAGAFKRLSDPDAHCCYGRHRSVRPNAL